MDIFLLLFKNILPLYALIGLGFIAGRFFGVERQSIGSLGIYILMPVMAFGFVAQIDFKPAYIALPIAYYALLAASSFAWLRIGRSVYGQNDKRANLLALCSTAGNTGYFGLPIIMALFPPEWAGVYIFIMLGGSVYESTISYYLAARGKFNVRDSLMKLLKSSALYAITAGLIFNQTGAQLDPLFMTYWAYFKGAYVVIGMMIIGAALSKMDKIVIAPRFLSLTFLGKFIIFPALMAGLIMLDLHFWGFFAPEIHKMLFILAIVPTAANIAAFAVEMDLAPEKAASTILIGTLCALVYIPVMLMLFDRFLI